jgi:succinyl-CoA synthetase beta subunit
MKIHEYQAKEVLGRFGVAVPEGRVVTDAEAAGKAYEELGTPLCVVKAQIHAGGRGKGGGVKLVKSAAEAVEAAKGMLGKPLITHQTGPEGKVVNTVWVEKGSDIDREFYLAVTLDRAVQKACDRARRQDELRRQRAVPPQGHRRCATSTRKTQGTRGQQARPQLHRKLDGNIGCMVNGAGLAMATMDIIKLYGGEPANFLDVGGGATKEQVTKAFKIILSPNVKGILVNIFGGIMRCDVIAEGVVAAAKEVDLHVPLVVRLEGTNVEQGKQDPGDSGFRSFPRTIWTRPREDRRRREGGEELMASRRQGHQGHLPGLHRRRRAPSTPSRRSPTAPRWSAA